jgi:FkbM family methyltransferase
MKIKDNLLGDLAKLLLEDKDAAVARESTEFDRLAGARAASLVLFGAGGLGRRTLRGLRQAHIEPLAFCDNNPALWGGNIEGVGILSVPDAARLYGANAAFVITVWNGQATDRMSDRARQLSQLGCETVVTWGPLYWKYSKFLLPHYSADRAHLVHDQGEAVRTASTLWSDEASLQEFVTQVRWRMLFDFDALSDPVRHPIYFPADLVGISDDEVFVDCGAYDGDTIQSFLSQPKRSFSKIVAFEPDPSNFARLEANVALLPECDRIQIRRTGVGKESGFVPFSASGTESSAMGSGESVVECVALDEVLDGEIPSYVKMDIEGSELDAIRGARRTIQAHRPVLAICSYHAQDHLWKIPLLISSYDAEYRFFLRPHLREVWDLVCYAIPKERFATLAYARCTGP